MSRFYGSIEGTGKTPATRRGHAIIKGHIRGWDSGVKVHGFPKQGEDASTCDKFAVYMTSGSNANAPDVLLGYVQESVKGIREWVPA